MVEGRGRGRYKKHNKYSLPSFYCSYTAGPGYEIMTTYTYTTYVVYVRGTSTFRFKTFFLETIRMTNSLLEFLN
jgi:hypothetical protein